jgi:hypothetical protein
MTALYILKLVQNSAFESAIKYFSVNISVRAGINPAPTKQVKQRLVGAGFTPARTGYAHLVIS